MAENQWLTGGLGVVISPRNHEVTPKRSNGINDLMHQKQVDATKLGELKLVKFRKGSF